MNMDQVMVLTYTDRKHKTRVIQEYEFFELFVCENSRGRNLFGEEDWLETFAGDFNYPDFNQQVLNGDIDDFEMWSRTLNHHWSSRDDGDGGVYGFVNAGVLDHRLFCNDTFQSKAPTDFKLWLDERREAHAMMNEYKIAKLKNALSPVAATQPKVVNERKSWLL